MFINLLLIVLILLRLWIAVILFVVGRQNKLTNLYWLGGSFLMFAVASAFVASAGNPLGSLPFSLWVFAGFGILWLTATIQFVSDTFYQRRRSAAPWIWGIMVVLSVGALYGVVVSPSPYQQHPLVALVQVAACVIFGWQGWAGYQAWRGVAKEKTVEDWVKGRYQLVIWYSLCQFVASLSSAVRIVGAGGGTASRLGSAMALVALLANIGMVVLAYLAWAAPQGYYRWLNRNYKSAEVREMSEEEVMQQMMGG